MALEKYNEKRDFKKTREPKGKLEKSTGALRFVVQKHAASHLHYDFRLEVNGVLVSWAVPKGPSANPSDKRLAMQTEDHPMAYVDFEGTIPKGQYGGGTVMVWDIGTFQPEGISQRSKDNATLRKMLREGNIKIILDGQKLKGAWHLVRMKDEERQWLLMKSKDEFSGTTVTYPQTSVLTGRDLDEIASADGDIWNSDESAEANKRRITRNKAAAKIKSVKAGDDEFTAEDLADAKKAEFPSDWKPQLATLADEPFDSEDWLFETKYDGYRALAFIRDGKVKLISRNALLFNSKYPKLVEVLGGVAQNVVFDGEIVVEDTEGKSRFQWLQHYDVNPTRGTLKFYIFDLLYFNGFDLRLLELIQRKRLLKAIFPKLKNIVYSEHVIGKGIDAFRKAEKAGGEGIIAKQVVSKYHTNKRTKDWLKIKTEMQQEVVIGGYTDPQGSRKGLGALLVGYYRDADFIYAGKVGSGYSESILADLEKKLSKLNRATPAFINPPKMKGAHWVKPELLAQVKFAEWTETGSMRHPVFLGLREDKPAKKVVAEKPTVKIETMDAPRKTKSTAKKPSGDNTMPKSRVEFTNTDKIFFPKMGITKGDVIRYYDSVADYILPYLIDRPQSLRRTPDGIVKEGFFQKNVAGMVPKWIKTKKIKSESQDETIEWLLCQDRDTLLYLANLGCIELNPWSSRTETLDHPDYIIFDLDPNKADMKKLVATALKVKEILDKLHLKGYVKTSGGKGIHVFIPVLPKYTYEQTRDVSLLISQMVHRELPDLTSLERMPKKREGKIYLDFLQNGRGKTMASVYSVRPREGAGVSTPLEWDEINDNLDLTAFNINTVPKRLQEKGELWADFFKDAIDLKKILPKL